VPIAISAVIIVLAACSGRRDFARGWDRLDEQVEIVNSRGVVGVVHGRTIFGPEAVRGALPGEMMFGPEAVPLVVTADRVGAKIRMVLMDRAERHDKCATKCLCTSGGVVPYGRYCGFLYTGCPGMEPCDDADECCKTHDECVNARGYTDRNCTIAFTKCQECVIERRSKGEWDCRTKIPAAVRMVADVKFMLAKYYREARTEAIAARERIRFD
jgi:hypothetical protein